MGDGTQENPYTREDVLRLIEENGGTAEGLDLSEKVFEEGIDLHGLDLSGVILKKAELLLAHLDEADLVRANLQDATLVDSDLQRANLASANLQDATLVGANLQGANLAGANLQGADLTMANLQGARLWKADLRGTEFWDANLGGAMLEDVKWDPKHILMCERDGDFDKAEQSYRNLKRRHAEQGLYDVAGEFFFREMEAKRKGIKWWPKFWHRGWLGFTAFICGHGERPYRVIGWAASVVLGSALIYFIIGSVWKWWAFWNYLYFSAVSFTALGYGSGVETTNDWIRGIGAFESFIGVFTIALFLITFTRKMRR